MCIFRMNPFEGHPAWGPRGRGRYHGPGVPRAGGRNRRSATEPPRRSSRPGVVFFLREPFAKHCSSKTKRTSPRATATVLMCHQRDVASPPKPLRTKGGGKLYDSHNIINRIIAKDRNFFVYTPHHFCIIFLAKWFNENLGIRGRFF